MKQWQTRPHACNATAGNETSLTSISKAFLLAVPANFSPSTIELPAVMLIQAWLWNTHTHTYLESNTHIFRVTHEHSQTHTHIHARTHTHSPPPTPHTNKNSLTQPHSHPYTESPTHSHLPSHPYTPTQVLSSDHYLHLPVKLLFFSICVHLCVLYTCH